MQLRSCTQQLPPKALEQRLVDSTGDSTPEIKGAKVAEHTQMQAFMRLPFQGNAMLAWMSKQYRASNNMIQHMVQGHIVI